MTGKFKPPSDDEPDEDLLAFLEITAEEFKADRAARAAHEAKTPEARAVEKKAFQRFFMQYAVDMLAYCEELLFDAELAEKESVALPTSAARILLTHFRQRPPNKLPLPSSFKAQREAALKEYRVELDRRVRNGETYKRVLHELSQKAAAEFSGLYLSLPPMAFPTRLKEKTAERLIQSPGSKPGKKKPGTRKAGH
jgi:hypothetical protein